MTPQMKYSTVWNMGLTINKSDTQHRACPVELYVKIKQCIVEYRWEHNRFPSDKYQAVCETKLEEYKSAGPVHVSETEETCGSGQIVAQASFVQHNGVGQSSVQRD